MFYLIITAIARTGSNTLYSHFLIKAQVICNKICHSYNTSIIVRGRTKVHKNYKILFVLLVFAVQYKHFSSFNKNNLLYVTAKRVYNRKKKYLQVFLLRE